MGHKDKDFTEFLNPDSLKVVQNAKLEPNLPSLEIGARYQFLRTGYFAVDTESTADRIVFNRTVTLKDGYKKGK